MIQFQFDPFPDLETERLLLRSFSETDIPSLFETRAYLPNSNFLDRAPYQKMEEAESFLNKIIDGVNNNEWINWGIQKKDNSFMVGSICLWNLDVEKAKGELGFEMHPDFQGKGIMTEAIVKVIDYGFSEMKLELIEAVTHQDNLTTVHILQKLNFQKVENWQGEYKYQILFKLDK